MSIAFSEELLDDELRKYCSELARAITEYCQDAFSNIDLDQVKAIEMLVNMDSYANPEENISNQFDNIKMDLETFNFVTGMQNFEATWNMPESNRIIHMTYNLIKITNDKTREHFDVLENPSFIDPSKEQDFIVPCLWLLDAWKAYKEGQDMYKKLYDGFMEIENLSK